MSDSAKYIKTIPDSASAYALLKTITDAAQAGDLKPWSPAIIDLLESYKVSVDRLKDVKVQVTLSFPTSTKGRSMAIGFRYAKADGSFAEDIFLFEEGVGLTCYYRGTQEEALPEYDGTHHAKIVLTELLPDIQRELAGIRKDIQDLAKTPRVELVTDEQYHQEIKQISEDFAQQVQSFKRIHGNTSAVQTFSMVAQREATKKRRALMAKKAASNRWYNQAAQEPIPEISLMVNAQANNNRFDVTFTSKAGKNLVAEKLIINGVKTELNQQFTKMYTVEHVNIPEGIFDKEQGAVVLLAQYRTLDGQQYKLTMTGKQEFRTGDKRYNVVFPLPSKIEAIN